MLEDKMIKTFMNDTKGNNYIKGERVYKNELVIDPKIELDNNQINIDGRVISENLYSEYKTNIKVDKTTFKIISTSCTCSDYERNEHRKNYACKHLCATYLFSVNKILCDTELKKYLLPEKEESIWKSDIKDTLLDIIAPITSKDKIKFEVYINRREWDNKIFVNFTIGYNNTPFNKLNALKDINAMLTYIDNKVPLKYSKDFTLDLRNQEFTLKDAKLLKFIRKIVDMDLKGSAFKKAGDKFVNGKYITIPPILVNEFLYTIRDHKVYLYEGFYYRAVLTEIILKDMDLPFDIDSIREQVTVKIPGGLPTALKEDDDIYLYNGLIYIPSEKQSAWLKRIRAAFKDGDKIFFEGENEKNVLLRLIPALQQGSSNISLSSSLNGKVVTCKPKFKFYFDKVDEITLKVLVNYNGHEINIFQDYKDLIIFRDKDKENEILSALRDFGLVNVEDFFVFFKDEEYIFNFFLGGIEDLKQLGEVYYSERFKGIKKLNSKSVKFTVERGHYDYFDLSFKSNDVTEEEFKDILRAFNKNLKYFKLKSGEFINLKEIELRELLTLLSNTSEIDDTIRLKENKVTYFKEYVDRFNLECFSGLEALDKFTILLTDSSSDEYAIPEGLENVLRGYQKKGYNWFKKLSSLHFGGLLGDEMGCGKTLQTIAFLASEKGSKSLVVAPTSLVYNWKDEVNKFYPNLKVVIVNESKKKREEIIKSYSDYDILITTYNLLRNDIKLYKEIDFDYCIIDEAQNIKNPSSKNAVSCKEIKAKSRFALTGTPIENSLMELWSIFDFIMPGYLYEQKEFEVRYYRRLTEDECILDEIKALIKPFILRRRKKDVLFELPDKISKNIYLDMSKEQVKAYKTFSKYAKDLIEKKVKDEEFSKSKIEILSYLTKLRQIALHPSLVLDDYNGTSGKMDGAIEIISDCIDEGHKILLFSSFTSVLNIIRERLKLLNIDSFYLDGATPSKERIDLVNKFNSNNIPIFLISLKAGGSGLNLTGADIVIHFDPWWNPAVIDQATDRAHRMGQENVVEEIKLISKGSIEEKILDLCERKEKLTKDILEEVEGEGFLSLLDEEDYLNLLK